MSRTNRHPERDVLLTVALKPRAMAPRVVALIEALKQWPEVVGVTTTALSDQEAWAAERRAAVALRAKLHALIDTL
jgi:hypothetical protein